MAIEQKQVTVYSCDGCSKKVIAPDDGDGLPTSGLVGTVVLGYDKDGEEVASDWFAHTVRCIRAAVEKAAAVISPDVVAPGANPAGAAAGAGTDEA